MHRELLQDSDGVNESFWDGLGVEFEAKYIFGFKGAPRGGPHGTGGHGGAGTGGHGRAPGRNYCFDGGIQPAPPSPPERWRKNETIIRLLFRWRNSRPLPPPLPLPLPPNAE